MDFIQLEKHEKFKEEAQRQLDEAYLSQNDGITLQIFKELIDKTFLLNLYPIEHLLKSVYSPKPRGTSPRDPVSMLRSLILMTLSKETSITKWVKTLKSFALFAILSGFESDNVPGIGTFYDFMDRLWAIDEKSQSPKIKSFKRKPALREKDKYRPAHTDINRKIKKRILRDESKPLSRRPDELLIKIFKHGFILPSANKDLLGDIENLSLSADGTKVKSGGRSYGKKICDCQSKKVYDCKCPRKFSDREASWGYDHYRDTFVYGRALHELTAADSPYDLPVYIRFAQCQRHDSVLGLVSLDEAKKIYPEFKIGKFIADTAYDTYSLYELLKHWGIKGIIDLSMRYKGKSKFKPPISVTKDGIPICQAGQEMVLWGYCKDRYRIKYRCPLKAGSERKRNNLLGPKMIEAIKVMLDNPDREWRSLSEIQKIIKASDGLIHNFGKLLIKENLVDWYSLKGKKRKRFKINDIEKFRKFYEERCEKKFQCQFKDTCSTSPYGRVIFVKVDWDLRKFTTPLRNSDEWTKEYAKRTSSERSFKRKKIDYKLESYRARSTKQWYMRTYFVAMCQHIDAWLLEKEKVTELATHQDVSQNTCLIFNT